MSAKKLPRELLFVKVVFWIGLIAGAMMLLIGVLGWVTGFTISVLGDGATQPGRFVSLLVFGLVETFFCASVLVVMRRDEPEVPDRVVELAWYLTLAMVAISIVRFLANPSPLDAIRDFGFEWALLVGFYLYISSVFRFMESVGRYYGRPASASRFNWVNSVGRGLVRYLQPRNK